MPFTPQDIQQRRKRLAQKWDAILNNDEAVLVFSGAPVSKPGGLEQTYPFLPHPAYYWLTGRRREGEVLLYSKNDGWVEFQTPFTKEQAVWEGEKNDLLVAQPGKDISGLQDFLKAAQFRQVYELGQSGDYQPTGKAFELNTAMDQTRRVKDAAEVSFIRQIATIAAAGYQKIEEILRPGITEKELQLAYENEVYRHGGQAMPYESIVGSGRNAAVLHALPTQKVIGENELVLVDAGVDVYDYCVDITRTFGSSTNMGQRQKDLYQLVLSVQESCIDKCRPGHYWHEVHAHAAARFTEGLRDLGILKGSVDTLIQKEVVSLFFPHGLGHLVGLRVRDTGHAEQATPTVSFGARLRVDMQLEPGHLITVEPGLYFIKALLEDPEQKARFKEDINWQELEQWKDIGGVRIEDNILITETAPDNLTVAVPKRKEI